MNIPLDNVSDILETPNHYLHKIVTYDYSGSQELSNEIDFLKYFRGPYLVMTQNTDWIKRDIAKKIDPDLNIMIQMANILKYANSNNARVFHLKELVRNAILNIPSDYPYRDAFINRCYLVLEDIKNKQYEEKLLESAVINYSPIVPYQGVIRKPGDESSITCLFDDGKEPINILLISDFFKKYKTRKEIVNNVIRELLAVNIIPILLYKYSESSHFFDCIDEYNIRISPECLFYNPKFATEQAHQYFLTVFLAYAFDEIYYEKLANNLFNSYNIIMDIKKGKIINVEKAIENLSAITILND